MNSNIFKLAIFSFLLIQCVTLFTSLHVTTPQNIPQNCVTDNICDKISVRYMFALNTISTVCHACNVFLGQSPGNFVGDTACERLPKVHVGHAWLGHDWYIQYFPSDNGHAWYIEYYPSDHFFLRCDHLSPLSSVLHLVAKCFPGRRNAMTRSDFPKPWHLHPFIFLFILTYHL